MYRKNFRQIHFVGIGGIGMSGIAEVLINLGYRITGSDMAANANVRRLQDLGARISVGHVGDNVRGADAVVYSSAVDKANPELAAARDLRIPVVPRAEMLAELMRLKYGIAIAGTHGKTTTTSLIATLLAEAKMDPTVVNGGILKALGSNACLGQGEFLVTEADESDGSFLKLTPTIAVVTNIDPEHMENYRDFDHLRESFLEFIRKVPFHGLAVLCRDHPVVAAMLPELADKRVVTYGLGEEADIRAVDIRREGVKTHFRVVQKDRTPQQVWELGEVTLSLPGRHNVTNTLAVVAVALELEIPWPVIRQTLSSFEGVQRRFDILLDRPERVVIDDYAHHPVEIRATLEAVRESFETRRRVAVFQPHRYSRVTNLLPDFLTCFQGMDLVVVDRVYAAGEKPQPGPLEDGGQAALCQGIREGSGVATIPLPTGEAWREGLENLLQPGDVVVFLGAGSISQMARVFAGGA